MVVAGACLRSLFYEKARTRSSENPTKLCFDAQWTFFAALDYIDWVREGKSIDTKEGAYCTYGYVGEINVTEFLEGVA